MRGRRGGRRGGWDSRYEWRSRARGGGGGGERCGSSIPGVRSAWRRRRHPSRGLKLQRSLCLPSRHLLLFFVFFTAAATQTPPIVNPPSALYWYHWSTSTSLITHFNITLYPISSFCRAQEMGEKKENCHRVSCVSCAFGLLLWVCCMGCKGGRRGDGGGGRQPLWLGGAHSRSAPHFRAVCG